MNNERYNRTSYESSTQNQSRYGAYSYQDESVYERDRYTNPRGNAERRMRGERPARSERSERSEQNEIARSPMRTQRAGRDVRGEARAERDVRGERNARTARDVRAARDVREERGDRAARSSRAQRDEERGVSREARFAAKEAAPASEAPAKGKRDKGKYIPALDGLRALAVLAVIAYHMDMTWAAGGLLGVTVFFVLSGYLITSLLIAEFDSTGRINLPQFWLRRIRRLVPAIVTVIVVTALLCTIFNHALLTKMRPDIVPSLFFFNNWWQIFHNVSYFENLGAPSPLTHFWSLAIEEQYYLLFPPLLFLAFRAGTNRTLVRRALLVLAAISALAMVILYQPGADPSRVYYGTDTRAFSLLIGAWMAFAWPSVELSKCENGRIPDRLYDSLPPQIQMLVSENGLALNAVGLLAFAGLMAMLIFCDGYTDFPYRGGILLCSVLTAITMAVLVHPSSLLNKFFALPPLVWIGKRSYGMYLWHFPILLLMTNRNAVSATPWWWLLLELAVIFGVSALSFRFVEDPMRKGALSKFVKSVLDGETVLPFWIRANAIPVAAVALVFVVSMGGIALVPDTSAVSNVAAIEQGASGQNGEATQGEGGATQGEGDPAAPAEDPTEKYVDVLLLGDSVMETATDSIESKIKHSLCDALINRQMAAGIELYEDYEKNGYVGPDTKVVIALGTNGPLTKDGLKSLAKAVGDHRTYIVNNRMPDRWQNKNNELLENMVYSHDNMSLIDWFSTSEGNESYFDGDGTHLTPKGVKVYTSMIKEALKYD